MKDFALGNLSAFRFNVPVTNRVSLLFCALALGLTAAPSAQRVEPSHAVVLVTLDGARIEEMFGGLDTSIVSSTLKKGTRLEDHALQALLGPTPEARREKLMPFFWGTLMREHGSIAGNPARGSRVHLTNATGSRIPATRNPRRSARTTTPSRATIRSAIPIPPCSNS